MSDRLPCPHCSQQDHRCDREHCDRVRIGEEYTLDQCRQCYKYFHDSAWNRYWSGNGETVFAPPPAIEPVPVAPKSLLLGDAIKAGLDRIGITQERMKKWFGCFGCGARQKALNDLHQWAIQTKDETVEKAKELLGKLVGEDL